MATKPLIAMGTLLALGSACAKAPQVSPTTTLETIAEFTDTRPGNIAVTPQGRIIVTQQPLDDPVFRTVELLPDGSKVPFPTEDWANGPSSGEVGLSATIGIAADGDGVVWLLDMGDDTMPPQLVAWDTIANRLHQVIRIPPEVITTTSFLQDFALDEKRGKIYIADMTFPRPAVEARPAFVVVDIASGNTRRVLEGADALMPVDRDVVINGSVLGTTLEDGTPVPWHLGLNPIAIDPEYEWVYFGTINGSDVYRLPAASLADDELSRAALIEQIERYSEKRPSDGIAVDSMGRVFVTDIEGSAIGVATPSHYRVLAHDDLLLSWPDGVAFGPDGLLYVTQNQLHAHPELTEGKDDSRKPYRIPRLSPSAPRRAAPSTLRRSK